jgi:hypothetical protein
MSVDETGPLRADALRLLEAVGSSRTRGLTVATGRLLSAVEANV